MRKWHGLTAADGPISIQYDDGFEGELQVGRDGGEGSVEQRPQIGIARNDGWVCVLRVCVHEYIHDTS